MLAMWQHSYVYTRERPPTDDSLDDDDLDRESSSSNDELDGKPFTARRRRYSRDLTIHGYSTYLILRVEYLPYDNYATIRLKSTLRVEYLSHDNITNIPYFPGPA